MKHPVEAPRPTRSRRKQASPAKSASSAPRRLASPEPWLLPLLLPIVIVGGLAMLHVVSLARLSELECESRRLERLTLEQTLRHGELMRERTQLTDTALLLQYAAKQGMVNPVSVRPVKVGVLPPGKVHWSLPGEGQPIQTNDYSIDLCCPPPVRSASSCLCSRPTRAISKSRPACGGTLAPTWAS